MQNFEDELKAPETEEEFEPLLPSGWQENTDFFDVDSWSDGTESVDGQTQEVTEETTTGEETGADNTPTTGEEQGATGQSAVEEAEGEPSGQTETTEKPARILKLKVNHEDREVNVDDMTDDDLRVQLQKAAAFDAMKDEQAKAKYRQIVQEQISAGMTKEIAELVAKSTCDGKTYALEDEPPSHEEVSEQEPTVASVPPVRDWNADVARLA